MDYFAILFLLGATCLAFAEQPMGPSELREAYFNGSSYIQIDNTLSLHSHIGLSFRSCVGGELFAQRFNSYSIQLSALADHVLLTFKTKSWKADVVLPLRSLDNRWHYVGIVYRPPELIMSDESGHSVVVANATYNSAVLTTPEFEDPDAHFFVGNMFSGCILEGPSIIFNSSFIKPHNVKFGKCPLTTDKCIDRKNILTTPPVDHCYHEPCMRHGVCISRLDRYECHCAARYAGNNCQIDNGPPCDLGLCQNGGKCEENVHGDYTCTCASGYYGHNCEQEVSGHPLCVHNPCQNNATCKVLPNSDTYTCTCLPGFTGINCETDIDDCTTAPQPPCHNGGVCQDGLNNYTCICTNTGYTGARCEININECDLELGPCLNDGICFDTYGSYVCHCQPGYTGHNCQLHQNECLSSPCLNGGTCEDLVGSYKCLCPSDTFGPRCTSFRRSIRCVDKDCPPHSSCLDYTSSTGICACNEGYYGTPGPSPNCTLIQNIEECDPNPCVNGGTCFYDKMMDSFNCSCMPGFTGMYCEQSVTSMPMFDIGTSGRSGKLVRCSDQPCLHAISCDEYSGVYYCKCEPGWTGNNCDSDINECLSEPCQNGGECAQFVNGFHCRCPPGYSGKTCQNVNDLCNSHPCQNGGSCMHKKNTSEFTCSCPPGFEGTFCEENIDDCVHIICPEYQVCYDGVNSYTCRCPDGFTGENCTIPTDFCASNPCINGTCKEGGGGNNYTCTCQKGYTGRNCETDIDECSDPGICNEGICVNKQGSYQCYCKPGFTGEHCNVDFDECLSRPCKNGGSCVNKINNYECICMPGFSGKDCANDINECESNPCMEGSTCIDGMATFTCICMEGLTGFRCEINIDDCESSPCLNGGVCEDGLNSYTCNCSDTGHRGLRCEQNIDDCASDPCVHGSTCQDGVKDYTCDCYPGYAGKNCEIDIQECESSPCQYRGECLERSNISLYQNTSYDPLNPIYINEELNMLLPTHFFQEFSYENASGFECVCISGITGTHCEVNINECESSPCGPWGTCVDRVGRYECECEDGFEGDHCQRDIDECQKFKPCVEGTCHDRRANYYCECNSGWGGKNCSVPLLGCEINQCLNNGTCRPWLYSETEHRFNCTCSTGYHGNTCEKVTTMSVGGHGYVVVNTSRDEGYDIQFRFRTTLANGLLALGKGLTFYILELSNGRLNLHSSILNKWEGVFVGSQLNNSNWQKVFVAINASHIVLAANEEQTIYPLTFNEASNISHTSFATTYIGGTTNYLSRLAHGPAAFVGCVEDVVINGEWVLPDDSLATSDIRLSENILLADPSAITPISFSSQSASWTLYGVQTHCPRVPQCGPKNPCHSGGMCTDLWTSFHCSCQRPYFGHTCQYNVTAATFGYENTSNSLVTVLVYENARRAVRSIVDISMFIRTRKPSGQIFYLGSKPRGGPYSEETFVAASLENGELFVRLQFNHTAEAYTVGGNRLDNGYNHLIQVVRNSTLVQVKLNGSEYFRKPISATGQLDAQVLYLGGHPLLSPSRPVRQAEVLSSGSGAPIHGNLRAEPITSSVTQADHFKGIIQDVQISNGSRTMIVEFFPLLVSDLEMPMAFGNVTFENSTILEGVVSDDSCASNPCKHNGTCHITWNDFGCICAKGYKGKSCQDIEFCQLQNCPIGSTCRNLDDGFECIANATFDGYNSTLSYNLTLIEGFEDEEPLTANSIMLDYRSKTGGTLLHIENIDDGAMFSVSVFRDQVTVQWKLTPLQMPKVRRFRKSQPDFQWTHIHLVISQNHIRGGFNDWVKDDLPSFTSDFNRDSWINLLKTGEIHLGGVRASDDNTIDLSATSLPSSSPNDLSLKNLTRDSTRIYDSKKLYLDSPYYTSPNIRREDYQNDGLINSNNVDLHGIDGAQDSDMEFDSNDGENFKGCLGEVRIGNLLLPFYTLSELYSDYNLLQLGRHYFSLMAERENMAAIGCILCFNKDCRNGGSCTEPDENYACTCPVGFAGDDCGIDVDECINAKCENNSTCVDDIGNYTCTCKPGWEGWLCDIDIDECAAEPCENGGLCTDLPGGFLCTCPDEFTGVHCASPRLLTCANHPCRAGSTCHNQKDPVTGHNFTCTCMPGMEGALCDIPYCIMRPCLNGGMCESMPEMTPVCKCTPGFKGKFCEINIDECRTQEGSSPCLNGGRCIDGIASYTCDCSKTGYIGANCDEDVDECINVTLCGDGGTCVNTDGSYICQCGPDKCGKNCSLPDPCTETRYREVNPANTVSDDGDASVPDYMNSTIDGFTWIGPCENGGTCRPMCGDFPDYKCDCIDGWDGKNCTQRLIIAANGNEPPIGIIVGGVVGGLCALGGIGLVVACMLARSKRATRGTYSPSGQEYRNPRLEMLDSVLKPPPEERLI